MSAPELLPCPLSDDAIAFYLKRPGLMLQPEIEKALTELQSLRSARQPGQDAAGDGTGSLAAQAEWRPTHTHHRTKKFYRVTGERLDVTGDEGVVVVEYDDSSSNKYVQAKERFYGTICRHGYPEQPRFRPLGTVGSAHTNAQHAHEPSSSSNPPDGGRLREALERLKDRAAMWAAEARKHEGESDLWTEYSSKASEASSCALVVESALSASPCGASEKTERTT